MNIYTDRPTFYYIDPSTSVSGDGSSVAKAATAFPSDLDADNVVYLVRRTADSYSADLEALSSTKTWSTPKTVSFIGMPKAGDLLYDRMPDDAKEAWGADESEYAYVTENTTSSYQHKFTNCTNFTMFRICFRNRHTNGIDTFYVQNTTYGTNTWIDHCWFRSALTDFPNAGAESVDYEAGERWINIDNAIGYSGRFAKITNTRFDHYGNNYAIGLGYTDDIYIDNCEFHCIQTDSRNPTIYWTYNSNLGQWGASVIATNLTARYYFWTHSNAMSPIIGGDCRTIKVSNVDIAMGDVQPFSCYNTTNCKFADGVISVYLVGTAGSVFENITAKLPTVGTCDTILKILYYQDLSDQRYLNYSDGQYNLIRNITIEAETEYSTSNYRVDWYSTPYNQTTNAGLIRYWGSGNNYRPAMNDCLIQNISINAPMGFALCVDNAILDLEDCDIIGAVYAEHCVGKIKSITTWYPGYALHDHYRNTLSIEEITCNLDNPRWEYNAQSAVECSAYDSAILVGSSNIRCFLDPTATSLSTSENRRCNYVCSNNQADGAYYARSYTALVETWSSYRAGSTSNCSLRLTNENVADLYCPLKVCALPFKGISQTAIAGDHTMTFYLAMYGYSDYSQICDRFFATITLPTGEKVFSNVGIWSLDEESTWNNLDGYTAYKLTIPFHMDEDGEITTTFSWSWYMVGAATFVDPFPTIE